MSTDDEALVGEIRRFNRFYTNILGLLNQDILDSPYSLTEVRILLEIDRAGECTANTLTTKLDIDRGYMSRIISRFAADGLVSRSPTAEDSRRRLLSLTGNGKEILTALEEKSQQQIHKMLHHLSSAEKERLGEAILYVQRCLSPVSNPVTIRPFRLEEADWIIERHKVLYEQEYGFFDKFGQYVDKYVRAFAGNYDASRENIWIAEVNGEPAGCIAIVRSDDHTAQLRWFLLEPDLRGMGLGHQLMQTVLDFCREKNYESVFLWTVSVLAAARHLYQRYGFTLTESVPNSEWSREPIIEERWDLSLAAGGPNQPDITKEVV